ncbi:MAG: hypothetical protein IJK81_11940 [Selenomonadaceae bacterium]|nr:hypothetical protein [Selenomonadaceae bacterium]
MTNIDYLYNPDVAKAQFKRNYFLDKKLGFQVIEHGTILPYKDVAKNGKSHWNKGGIVDSKGGFIAGSGARTRVTNVDYTPPMNQSNTVPKPLFI